MVRRVSLIVLLLVAAALVPAPASAQDRGGPPYTAGAPGIGDPYFPLDGNGGYDVRHYDLRLAYAPPDPTLTGVATILARATQNLSSFNLDLVGMNVESIRVNGRQATWTRDGQELVVTPQRGLREGRRFVVSVRYSGVPQPFEEGTGRGWLATDDGAMVVGQPHGATTWFPANDHPADKATYAVHITVPEGVEAISNGRLTRTWTHAGSTTWNWSMRQPMASYLATATIGQFELTQYRENGIRYLDAIDPDLFQPFVAPTTGDRLAFSQSADATYKRLVHTVTVPADGAQVAFQVNRQTEADFDFFFVEAHTVGADDWTTLPDLNGHSTGVTGLSCPSWLALHPFLTHYQTASDDGGCSASGSTGTWSAASGLSDGYESWNVDLSAFAGSEVELALTYASEDIGQGHGVFVDDVTVSTGEGTTSFEEDADTWDGWTVPGAPDGSAANVNDWAVTALPDLPSLGGVAREALAELPEIHALQEGLFGPYPFRDGGGIVDDVTGLGFALENQTRPIYALEFFRNTAAADNVVVHETAHQWFGDSVSVARWQDIWLNEGFATFAEWLRSEQQGGPSTAEIFDLYYNGIPAEHPFWSVVIGDPGPDALLDIAVYWRGAMAVQVLRETVGDDAFFRILQTWTSEKAHGNGSIDEFLTLAEKISGADLDALFHTWLYTGAKPAGAESVARSAGVALPEAAKLPWEAKLPVPAPRK
jgi:hypothetical protein